MIGMRQIRGGMLGCGVLVVAVTDVRADTITVCSSGCDHTSIQAAIDAASDGDVIQLSAETYSISTTVDTGGKQVTIQGATDKSGSPATILDGGGACRVLICQSGETSSTIFRNLRVTNGAASSYPDSYGGGMLVSSSGPLIQNCDFVSNSAEYGGGLAILGGPVLTDCRFLRNLAISSGGAVYHEEASYLVPVSGTFVRCEFEGNRAEVEGGGGFHNMNGSPVLDTCTFVNNQAIDPSSGGTAGGGLLTSSGGPSLSSCVFTFNLAGEGVGAAIHNGASILLTDCDFCGNAATGYTNMDGEFVTIGGNAIDASSSGNRIVNGLCVVGDLNFDGEVTLADRTALNEALGVCAADIDGDGQVTGADIAFILSFWGGCVP